LFSIDSAQYILRAPQRRASDRIKASFGKLGRVDMRFVRESIKESAPPLKGICSGSDTVTESGHYVGFFAFRGEHGYTRVRVHSAAGTITKKPALTCNWAKFEKPGKKASKKPSEPEEKEAAEVQSVRLIAVAPVRHVVLIADRIAFKAGRHPSSLSNFI